jgi:two-component system, NarL family, response regulator EvgA
MAATHGLPAELLFTDTARMDGEMSTVLIVGNDDYSRASLRALLQEGGGFDSCVEAGGSIEALDKARRLLPHLVILDFSQPEMNGFQLAHDLREIMPRLPIFMLTADQDIYVEREALSCGIDAVFSKLGDLDTLPANARAVCGID